LNNGGFLAHRNPKESEDEPELRRPTHAGASRKAGPRYSPRHAQAPFRRGQDPHRPGRAPRRGKHRRALCRREAIAESLYYAWSKEFLEAGKRRLAGDTARAATSDEVKALRQEARALKEVVAEQALELRLLKKSMIADGDDRA